MFGAERRPEGSGHASKTCEKKRLCEPVCLTINQLEALSQQAVCLNAFVSQLSLPVFHTCERHAELASWLLHSIDLAPLGANYSSKQSRGCSTTPLHSSLRCGSITTRSLAHNFRGAMTPCSKQLRCPRKVIQAICFRWSVLVQTPKVQFQPHKKMFQNIGRGQSKNMKTEFKLCHLYAACKHICDIHSIYSVYIYKGTTSVITIRYNHDDHIVLRNSI